MTLAGDRFPFSSLFAATTNPHKVRELRSLLGVRGIHLQTADEVGKQLPAVEENGATIAANARQKAQSAALALQAWVLADDTALEVDGLGGRPGVHSARFAGPQATMVENCQTLVAAIANLNAHERCSRFVCHLCLADPHGEIILEAEGQVEGLVMTDPRGGDGFGYDGYFFIAELQKTMAELTDDERNVFTHRARALDRLCKLLAVNNFGNTANG